MEFEKSNALRSKVGFLAVIAVLAIVVACFAASPVSAEDEDKILYIHGTLDASIIGSESQVIVVNGDLAVEDTQFIVAKNTFIVNEGVTLTLKSGSYVEIYSGEARINGAVVSEAGTEIQPTFCVDSGSSLFVSGTVSASGPYSVYLADGSSSELTGTFTVEENGSAIINGMTVKNGGKLILKSTEAAAYLNGVTAESGSAVEIYGNVLYDTFTVQDGAEFSVKETGVLIQNGIENFVDFETIPYWAVNNGTITVNGAFSGAIQNNKAIVIDSSSPVASFVRMSGGSTYECVKYTGASLFGIADADLSLLNVSGVTVKVEPGASELAVVGTPAAVDSAIGIMGTVLFPEDIVFPAEALVAVAEGGTMMVSGYLTMIASTEMPPITGTGTLTVTGTVKTAVPLVIKSSEHEGLTLNAVYYMKDSYHYYTTLDKALAADADYIKVYGDIVFDTDTIIPSGRTIDMTEANSITITKNATVTVKDGGIFRNGNVPIKVDGTLLLENTPTSETTTAIVDSDVVAESGITTKFTNLKRALAEAQSGDVIYLKRNHVYISEDTVIPEGVTLRIGSGNTVEVVDGAKLTVNGLLDAHPGYFLISNGSTIVNGSFIFDAPFNTYTDDIAGAYFTLDDVNTIAPLSFIQGKEPRIGDSIDIFGDIEEGDVSLVSSAVKPIVIQSESVFKAGTIALDGFTFDTGNASCVKAKIAMGEGAVTYDGTRGSCVTENGVTEVSGNISAAESGASVTFSGKLTVYSAVLEGVTVKFTEDADVLLANAFTFYEPATIPAGARVTAPNVVTGDLTIGGTYVATEHMGDLAVLSGGSVESEGDLSILASEIVVDGSISAASVLTLAAENVSGNGTITGGDNSIIVIGTMNGGNIVVGDSSSISFTSDLSSLSFIDAGKDLTLKAVNITVGNASAGEGASIICEGAFSSSGKLVLGDRASVQATGIAVSELEAGNEVSFIADDSIAIRSGTAGDSLIVSAGSDFATDSLSAGEKTSITAASAVVGDLNLGSGSSDILAGDFTVNGNSEFGTGCKLSADNVTINGKLVLYTGVKVTVNGILNVPGELVTVEADDSSKTESFIVKKDVNVSGKLDLGIINYVQISGDLNVSGTAVMGTTDKISGSIVNGNTSVASGGVLTISENSIWACLKDLNVDGTFNAGKGSLVAVGSEFVKENGTVAVSGNIYAAAGSNFTASNLIVPGTFTSEGTVVIGLLDSNGISTIDGTVDVRAGTFTMYRTVYINGSVLTENGKFYASKIYAGVNESIFGLPIEPASKVPVIGSGVSLTSSGVAYVSPAVRVNGAFSDFAHTYYYKGDTHYLSVYANPGKYSDKADGKNRNIDSIYASADNAYVNGWRATKEVSSSAEAAAARVYSPYGTYDTVWLNAVYDIFNFKLYAADETATPMVGKVNADGSVVPLTLYKSGLNLYESPVNLPAGTYRVKMTYADGHSEEYIDNPMIVNGVRQSSYDFTFDGNPGNKETVTYLIQFSFEEEPAPIVEPDQSLTITDILLIILVIVIIIIAIVLILRSRRS